MFGCMLKLKILIHFQRNVALEFIIDAIKILGVCSVSVNISPHRKVTNRAAGFSLQTRHYSSLPEPNLQPTANQERNDHCGNENHSRELLIMGIVVPETC